MTARLLVVLHDAAAPVEQGSPESAAVERLRAGPAEPAELESLLADTTGLARWMSWATRAQRRGFLAYALRSEDGALLAELTPVAPSAPCLAVTPLPVVARVRLSRFAMLRRVGDDLVLESPRATMRARLTPDAVVAVTARTMRGDGPLLSALLAAGLLTEVDDAGRAFEDEDAALAQWEPHDLLMHTRTRTIRRGAPSGGTFRFAGALPAPPAVRHPRDDVPRLALPRPDLARLMAEDPPFARVMERRASQRELAPPTIAQVGEFLFRTSRVRGLHPAVDDPRGYPTTDRPYPSAGAMYELTTYLAVSACDGIPAGLWRYDPVRHDLELAADAGPDVDRLLRDAGRATGGSDTPPLLVILAADFRRVSWKYEGIAYALTMKNVGVLYQSMQLAATAMGLAGCPLGLGDAELFARAIGTRLIEESSVGEFLLGAPVPG